jgi:ABC-type dipeptide/oligopeptide/nickel transport system permease subunit
MPTYIRMVYGLVLSIRENDYIVASKLIGQSGTNILLKHLLPNCVPTIIVMFTMNLGTAIMLESTLSYLGIGIKPPIATWGGMVSEGFQYIQRAPHAAIIPGVCMILVIIAFNIVGDSLRDALDPKLRGKL